MNQETYALRGSSFPWRIVLKYVFLFLVIFTPMNLSRNYSKSCLNKEIELGSKFLYHVQANPIRDNENPLQSSAMHYQQILIIFYVLHRVA